MYRLGISVALAILMGTWAAAQSTPQQKTLSQSTSPNKEIVLIASQPTAPIRIESASLVSTPSHDKWTISFELRNVGTKPVRRIIPGLWTSLATGGTLQPQPETGDLQPGAVLKITSTYGSDRNEPPSEPPIDVVPKVLIVLSIEDVTFTDGMTYSDHSTSKALMSYFENVSDKLAKRADLTR